MLRTGVERRLRKEYGADGRIFPAYETFCFANVPHSIASILGVETGQTLPDEAFAGVDTGVVTSEASDGSGDERRESPGVETVVVVLIDGLGLNRWKSEHEDHLLLDRLTDRGTVTPLTSTYPSETAAAMTTFETGALPADHGVIGWNVFDPTVDEEFEALPYRTKDGAEPSLPREAVANADPFAAELSAAGIDVRHVVPPEVVTGAETYHRYDGLDEFGATLSDAVEAASDPSFVYAYAPQVDHAAHAAGTESDEYRETLASVTEQVERSLLNGVDEEAADDTLLVVTADHGHVDTDPDRNVDLSGLDVVTENLRRRADGTPIRFAGSPRNVHLHLQEGSVERVRAALRDELDALVLRREEVLERGLYGDCEPSATFERRLGDLVVTHRDLGVWYGDAEPEELDLVGMHGGLHPHEMLVPFAVCRLSSMLD